jgi:adenylate kinase
MAHVREREPRDVQQTGSSVIREIIAPATFDDFDAWTEVHRAQVREQAIRRLDELRRLTAGRLLIDGHFVLRNRRTGTLEPVFTPGDCGFYDALALVDPPAAWVAHIRATDTRQRKEVPVEQIEVHLSAERYEANRLAAEMSVPLLVIRDVDLDARLRSLATFLDSIATLKGVP